jgi:hypothetical protein
MIQGSMFQVQRSTEFRTLNIELLNLELCTWHSGGFT